METFIVTLILAVILGGAAWYIYKSKKAGVKCIGCPDGASCGGQCGSCSGCAGGCSK